MRIAFDAEGGDHAPEAIIQGVELAAKNWPKTQFILLGQDFQLSSVKEPYIQTVIASERIEADDEPVRAVRQKKKSSIVMGCLMLKNDEADVFISAGNTGALIAAGLFYTGRLKGVERPALAPTFPTIEGKELLVLDVGANPEPRPEHMRQYACMGSIYAERVLGRTQPKVGLLNIGTEEGKGTELIKSAYDLLKKESSIRFVGNVEARDILYSPCDVLVCDGFSGNILLKSTEGVAKAIFSRLKDEFQANFLTKLGASILKPGLKSFVKSMDYKEHGGAPVLGLAKPVIKAHGSSDARAVYHAIRQAHLFVENSVISQMKYALAQDDGGNK